ncbi:MULTISPECIES: methyltransferase family protein [Bacillaceae]|uniref:Isoprenylcysteine carboxylmethyltransferase family protein n=1 Tax=Evansella alkalicola TaxID=745819 RepID=A0ABS6JUD0_9BACI|nr:MULTISPECIES: isoprenylcysteine carboxylmethyltransferase family protein [Bacillaceae]MBU9722188.1 isoprenylcysteine carboxylmethyltransferase family protein [Bacillus alkalicola]
MIIFPYFAQPRNMNAGIFIFTILLTGWLLEWIVYQDTGKKTRKEVNKKALLYKLSLAGMFLLAVCASYSLSLLTESSMAYTKTFGLLFFSQGLFLRYWTYYLIKPHFTRTIVPLENRPLYSQGPFRFTRHPFHTGFFFISLGISLYISGNWLSILTTFLFVGSALHYRMAYEENYYQKKYGDIYIYWCKHRFRLLPFLY